MAYDEVAKKATIKYMKTKLRRIPLDYKKEEFESDIRPFIEKSGLPTATFIKQAVREKIERDFGSQKEESTL